MLRNRLAVSALIPAGLLLVAAPVKASPLTVVYDNISASTGATSGGTVGVNAAGGGPLAESFSTAASASSLADVKLLLSDSSPTDGSSFTISLYSNASNTPGSLISTLATVNDSTLTSNLATHDFPITASVPVAASTRYWLELSAPSASLARWSFDASNVGVGTANEYNYFSGSATANSVFTPYQSTISTGTVAVPEPASLSLLAAGGLGLLRRRRSSST